MRARVCLLTLVSGAAGLLLWAGAAFAEAATPGIYYLDGNGDTVIGSVEHTLSHSKDTLLDIARRNNLGYTDIKLANPNLDTWYPGRDKNVVLPTEYVLPVTPHKGIVLNIPEMRLYYYPSRKVDGRQEVITYPLGIGRAGWGTPYVTTRVTAKIKNPVWIPPKSIREEHAAEGHPLPDRIGPGPDDPLGDFALKLSLPSYLIHGTNKPWGVGMRVSHGCIRLYPEDIEALFKIVPVGTPVRIVDQPYKVGLRNGNIYLEAHPYLKIDANKFEDNLTSVVGMIVKMTSEGDYRVNWDLARKVIDEHTGIPVRIGRIIPKQSIRMADGVKSNSAHPAENQLKLKLDPGPAPKDENASQK